MAKPGVSTRRTLLACAGAVCAAALADCARYNSNNGGIAGRQASSAPVGQSSGPAGPAVLASTADIPVGGGKVLTDQKIVITKPKAGEFSAFTAVCTHLGCIVGSVSGGTINGPAVSPLAPVSIKVQGASIIQG